MEILFFIVSLIYTVRGLFSDDIERITYRVFDEKTYKICLGIQNAANCIFCVLIAILVLIQTVTNRDIGEGIELMFGTQFACNVLYIWIVYYIASPRRKDAILKLINAYKADHPDLSDEELLLAFCRENTDISLKEAKSAIKSSKPNL
jgi:hypothetical protein